jgi:hypothetical protein
MPVKKFPVHQTSELLVCKVLTHGFLEENDVQLLLADEVPQLGFSATPAKTPHVPARDSH